MAIDCGFVVGYGGYAAITPCFELGMTNKWINNNNIINNNNNNINTSNIFLVRVLSASITRDFNIPTVNSYYLPYDLSKHNKHNQQENDEGGTEDQNRVISPIRIAYGTYTFNGQISMELSSGIFNFLDEELNFFERNYVFNIIFFDGELTCTIQNCMWSNIKISSGSGNIASISISFQSNNGGKQALDIKEQENSVVSNLNFQENDLIIPYWQTGIGVSESNDSNMDGVINKDSETLINVTDFSIGFDRSLTPVFLNNKLVSPTYIRAGLVNITLDFTSLERVILSDNCSFNITFGSKKIILKLGCMKNESYSNSTLNDIGNKSYQFVFFSTASNNEQNTTTINHVGDYSQIIEITDSNMGSDYEETSQSYEF